MCVIVIALEQMACDVFTLSAGAADTPDVGESEAVLK